MNYKMTLNQNCGYKTELCALHDLYLSPNRDIDTFISKCNKIGRITHHDNFCNTNYSVLYDKEKS